MIVYVQGFTDAKEYVAEWTSLNLDFLIDELKAPSVVFEDSKESFRQYLRDSYEVFSEHLKNVEDDTICIGSPQEYIENVSKNLFHLATVSNYEKSDLNKRIHAHREVLRFEFIASKVKDNSMTISLRGSSDELKLQNDLNNILITQDVNLDNLYSAVEDCIRTIRKFKK